MTSMLCLDGHMDLREMICVNLRRFEGVDWVVWLRER